jgi:hypothetical protein
MVATNVRVEIAEITLALRKTTAAVETVLVVVIVETATTVIEIEARILGTVQAMAMALVKGRTWIRVETEEITMAEECSSKISS